MYVLSIILKELLKERKLTYKSFAAQIEISTSSITNYIRYNKLPTLTTLVAMADYFNCSTDYLLFGKKS